MVRGIQNFKASESDVEVDHLVERFEHEQESFIIKRKQSFLNVSLKPRQISFFTVPIHSTELYIITWL